MKTMTKDRAHEILNDLFNTDTERMKLINAIEVLRSCAHNICWQAVDENGPTAAEWADELNEWVLKLRKRQRAVENYRGKLINEHTEGCAF